MTYMANRVRHFGTTIFFEMTSLANEHQAINLGQGFPDFPGPDFLKKAAIEAITHDVNQYAPGSGQPRLRQAITAKTKRFYNLDFDPNHEVIVTHGATEAIFATILGLVNPGEEVIFFEPFYDSYVPSVEIAGGIPKFYTLRPPNWAIDGDELAKLFSDKTKLIVVNSPHNPTGKVFNLEELQLIAALCQRYDVLAVTDDVYEHIIFDGLSHIPLASLPGMADRTIMISSAGKTYSMTGWKVGWVLAKPQLLQAVFRTHQFMTYSGATPLQEAVATALQVEDSYYHDLRTMYEANRNLLVKLLDEAGLQPITPHGTYFAMAEIGHLGFADDLAFCHYLTKEIGVTAIPPASFYHDPKDGATLARFAFCKTPSVLEEAGRRLQKLNVS